MDRSFLLNNIQETIAEVGLLNEKELAYARKIEADLIAKKDLKGIFVDLIDHAATYDVVSEDAINMSVRALRDNLYMDYDLLLFLLKQMIEKALENFNYYPYLLMNSVFPFSKKESFVSMNQKFADKIIPELTPLLSSDFYQNNLFALKMANQCFNEENHHLSANFRVVAAQHLNDKKWEIRQQLFYVFKKHHFSTQDISRSFWDQLSWPYFLYYRQNKTWL